MDHGRQDRLKHRTLDIDEAKMSDPRTWFEWKTVGIGWTPRTWEGCAIIAAVIAVGAVVGRLDPLTSGSPMRILYPDPSTALSLSV